jgi:hypothetical protein
LSPRRKREAGALPVPKIHDPGPRFGPEKLAIAVIGGGFAGSIFALKLSLTWPRARIFLIERSDRLGVGVAYGAC